MAVPFETNSTDNTILDIVKEAAGGIKQVEPPTLASSSRDVKQWVRVATQAGRSLRRRFLWPALNKSAHIVSQAGILSYPFPVDFDRVVFDTFWQQSVYRPLLGPLTPREYEAEKRGQVTSSSYLRFRLGNYSFDLLADPGVQDFYFQFQSTNWLLPTLLWAAGASVVTGEFCYYGGNVYKALNSGVTGATPPIHTSSSVSDDAVTWEYVTYDKVVEDGARPLLDRECLILGMQARWLKLNGFEYESTLDEYKTEVNKKIGALAGARSFQVGIDTTAAQFMDSRSIPDGVDEY